MAIQNNQKLLHRKEWQMMNPAPVTSVAASFLVKDPIGYKRTSLYVTSATSQYMYSADEDAWMQIPSMALAGTFGAGACGAWGYWSNTLTANGGSTTSVTTATAINSAPLGQKIRFLTGTNIGKEVTVTSVSISASGGTNTLNFTPALSAAIISTDTFAVSTGRYFVMNAGTIAAGIFKSIDPLTGVVTSLGTTNLPTTWGTDGKLIGTPAYAPYVTGTATSATTTTLVNSAKSWTANNWCNYQVRITAGTGIGQVRTITTNTSTTLTVPTWTTTPDATSVYSIEANDDFLYLIGNNAVTMYRYSISGATWTVLAPTTARAGTPVAGLGGNWAGNVSDAVWNLETFFQNGRYIYSFRGGSSTLDRYDIAGGTAGAGAWNTVTYLGASETFSTGSSYDIDNQKIYIKKESTGRFFYYDVIGNYVYPFTSDLYPDSTAILGDKLITVTYVGGLGNDTIVWLYYLQNTGTVLRRIMIY